MSKKEAISEKLPASVCTKEKPNTSKASEFKGFFLDSSDEEKPSSPKIQLLVPQIQIEASCAPVLVAPNETNIKYETKVNENPLFELSDGEDEILPHTKEEIPSSMRSRHSSTSSSLSSSSSDSSSSSSSQVWILKSALFI